ncbi:unnamed protein product, partial [Medioppia subpectinata]
MSETSQTNVDYLLEKFTITEIIDIQNKLKTDIDRKKQELKQLVGERYGDLIEAVDTIKQMNQSVDNVLNSLQSLASSQSNHMLSLKQSSFDKTNGFDEQHSRRSVDLVKRYKCGVILKLVIEMPLNIWTSLEKEDLLRSTYDYFYGQHLCQLFEQLVPANETPNLLKQYKTAINRFNEVIVKKCWHFDQKSSLMDTLDESTNADIFCCLLVLQNLNPNNLFDTVLEKRKSDEGKTVTSKIEVPLQMSSFLHNNFTQLSNEVNRLTGHTVPRVVVIDTLSTLSQHLNQLYGSACDGLSGHEYPKSIKQVIALQLYFDLLYFKQLLATTRDESIKSKQVVKI